MFVIKQAILTLRGLVLASSISNIVQARDVSLGPSVFTAPGAFPTSAYKHYYNSPTATHEQVQPIISDPVLHKVYPERLTSPNTIPTVNGEPHILPPQASASQLLEIAFQQVVGIVANPAFDSSCSKCIASLEVVKFTALAAPSETPTLMTRLCNYFELSSTCESTYGIDGTGSLVTQVFANADMAGNDGQYICHNYFGTCSVPPTAPLNLTSWFAKPKPNPLPLLKKSSGEKLKVLHLSDFHLDPRYATGSEANCTSGICCRSNNPNPSFPDHPSFPAPRFGALLCDTPYALAFASLEAIPVLSGTQKSGFDFIIYTGDLVSHDGDNQLGRDYVTYTETVAYDLFKRFLGPSPIYTALGNHDSYNSAQDAPQALGGELGQQFSWNYDHVSSLWQHEGWINEATVKQAKAHYGAYSIRRSDHLRVITLNTDMWYSANLFNYINMTNPDVSGMLRFLTDELQEAEDVGDRVWILGHVPPGGGGSDPLFEPSNLFYQIVDRFSPHVIANTFFGHTHQDQFSLFYQNNGTNQNAETALAVSWIGPSIVPRTNYNPGFRVYEVDSATFDIVDAFTFYSNISEYPSLDSQIENGPTWSLEYSTRDAYGSNIAGWGPSNPLNATWWHKVTEEMLADPSLVETFTEYQGRKSVATTPCTTNNCVQAKVCYMRSGSSSISAQNCLQGF